MFSQKWDRFSNVLMKIYVKNRCHDASSQLGVGSSLVLKCKEIFRRIADFGTPCTQRKAFNVFLFQPIYLQLLAYIRVHFNVP